MTKNTNEPEWWGDVLLEDEPTDSRDEIGIVRQTVDAGEGVEFHERMGTGTTLRSLQHRHLHLAYWESPYYRAALQTLLDDVDPTDLVALDLGCGDGRFIQTLADMGFEKIVAVDANLSSLRSLAAHAERAGVRNRLLLIHAGAETVRLRPQSMDVILAIGVLYYLNEAYEAGLAHTAELLCERGTLVASEPDLEGAALKALLFEGLDDFVGVVRDRRFTETHEGEVFKFRAFDPEERMRLYREVGLDPVESQGLSILPSVLRIGMVRGHFGEDEIEARESELRQCFDYFADRGVLFKHVLWKCRKSTKHGASAR